MSGVGQLAGMRLGRDMILAEGNICLRSELQEWKSTPVGHAGLRVRPPYKGIVEAEDRCTGLHMHTHLGGSVHLWLQRGGRGVAGW